MSAIANLQIEQGTSFSSDVTVTTDTDAVFDLTGYASYAQMSKGYATSHTRTSLTTSNNTDEGVVTISLTAAQTSNLEEGRYLFDVVIVKLEDSTVTRVLEGIITVNPRISTNY
jgi:hypothetical protein